MADPATAASRSGAASGVGGGRGGRRQSASLDGRRKENATRGSGWSVREVNEVRVAPWYRDFEAEEVFRAVTIATG